MSSTLDQLAQWIAESLEPLTLALEAGNDATLSFLQDLGYDLPAVPAAVSALGPASAELMTALDQLLQAIEAQEADPDDTGGYMQAATTMTVATVELIVAMAEMDSQGLPPGIPPEELARRIVELLVIRALDRRGMKVASVLRLLGIIDVELVDPVPAGGSKLPVARIMPERLLRVIGEPAALAQELYGWGTAQFNSQLLFRRAADVAIAFNRPFYFAGINPGVATLAGITADDPDPVLRIPLLEDPVTLTAVAIGLPASGAKLPGLGLTMDLSASGELEIPFNPRTKLVIAGAGSLAGGFLLTARPDGVDLRFDLQNVLASSAASASVTLVRAPADGETRVPLLNIADVVLLDAVEARVGVGASVTQAEQDVYVDAELKEGKLAIGMGKADGFLAKMLPEGGLQMPLALHVTWSRLGGLRFEGGVGLTIRSSEHRELGPLSIELIEVTIILGTTGVDARGTINIKLALGPLVVVVDQIGAKADILFKPGNMGPVDFALGFKPPSGAGLSIKAGPVTGGGYIFFDPDNEQYAGVLQLSFQAINIVVIGLLTTRLPDASGAPGATKKGFSLLLIIAIDLPPIQLGYGFTLNGVGGLLGINRSMLIEPLRSGIKNRTVDSILFPQDPIARAAQIISNLRTIFPPVEGRFVFGPMVKIGWGPNSIIEFSAAVILELLAPIRLVILGRIQCALPDKKEPVLNLRLDIVGVLDFDRSEASVDASLVDSKLTVFAITGDMAMRVSWGATKIFLLAAGGFNRKFLPPPGLPPLERLGIALANSDNPRLRLGCYLAITPNTIQFGAELDIYAKVDTFVGVFSLQALATFDAMIQFQPFEFRADLAASIDICRNNVPFFHAALAASFTGPNPWHAVGYAEFECCGKHRIDVEATAGEPLAPPEVRVSIGDVALQLTTAISRPDAWAALPPAEGAKVVSLCDAPVSGTIAVHPLGTLTLRQRVLPLGKVISRFGTAVVDDTTFEIAFIRVGSLGPGQTPTLDAATLDDFAPGQFEALTEDQRLARPAFEAMRSGMNLRGGKTALPADGANGVSSGIEYEEVIVDVEPASGKRAARPGSPSVAPAVPSTIVGALVGGGGSARSQTLATGADQFGSPSHAFTVSGERFTVANADTLDPAGGSPAAGFSCAEANDRVKTSAPADSLESALLHEAA